MEAQLLGHNKQLNLKKGAECLEWAAWTMEKGQVEEKISGKKVTMSK